MSQERKRVLVVEDSEGSREAIVETLIPYGFDAEGGESIARSRELLERPEYHPAVVILDMNLHLFPDAELRGAEDVSKDTGIDVVRGLLERSPDHRPQIIIISAHDSPEYYRQAIEAGAAAFLARGTSEHRRVFVQTVQALALRHAFQPSAANDAVIARLAEGHANGFELLSYFCATKLAHELDLCLTRASYVLTCRHKDGAARGAERASRSVATFSEAAGVPAGDEFDYAPLHRRVFEQVSRHAPYAPAPDELPPGDAGALKDFIFVQLVNTSEVEIALGMLSPFPVRDERGDYPFSTRTLAEVLVEKASPAVETFVEKLVFRWREGQSVKSERARTLAALSGAIQRELGALLPDKNPTTAEQASGHFERLRRLARELSAYSRTLASLLKEEQSATRAPKEMTTRLSAAAQDIKTEYDRMGYFDRVSLGVEADCEIRADPYYFSLALRELMRWAVGRAPWTPGGTSQLIRVGCVRRGDWVEVHFGESSERLSAATREGYLFEPFSPLHVARMIVEVACHGKLVDATDELKTADGHLFKIILLDD